MGGILTQSYLARTAFDAYNKTVSILSKNQAD